MNLPKQIWSIPVFALLVSVCVIEFQHAARGLETRSVVMNMPVSPPMPPQTSTPAKQQRSIPSADASKPPNAERISSVLTIADKPIRLPTDHRGLLAVGGLLPLE